jgi:tRNA(fMet)-specific endonuclease VapC
VAPRWVGVIRGFELAISFMTLAEMSQGALAARWGQRKRDVLEEYLAEFFVLHSDSGLCST